MPAIGEGTFRPRRVRGLVPDCGGAIQELAMAMPGAYLAPGHDAVRRALGALVASFDAAFRLTVLVGEEDRETCVAWIASLDRRCAVSLAGTPFGAALKTLWIQDRFLCREASTGGRRTYLYPPSSKAENMAAWLAAFDGSDIEETPTGLSGGNCLVGEDNWFAGAASLGQSVAFLPAERKTLEHAWKAIAAADGRRLEIVGHSYADLKRHAAMPCGEAEAGNLRQPVFHLDVFLTPTGETIDGKPLLLVGEPVAIDGTGAEMSYCAPLAAVCRRLAAAGFAVLRNPAAVLPARRDGRGPRFWRPYNNVILQNRPERIVWLPQFADDEWPELQELDDENASVWRDRLGFTVRRIGGWGAIAALGGGLRCVTKVIRRDTA